MSIRTAYNHLGKKIVLEPTSSSGAEGKIYIIKGNQHECAKIYHDNKFNNDEKKREELHEKIKAMISNPPTFARNTAGHCSILSHHLMRWIGCTTFARNTAGHCSMTWPTSILYNDASKTQFIGFTMPFIDKNQFKESHLYYDSKSRLGSQRGLIGSFTWKNLLTAACNIALLTDALHKQGHRIGDFREKNILMAPNALITIVDCDSFHVYDKINNRDFTNNIGFPEFQPPEWHSNAGRNQPVDRYYSDLFALGIIIFKFLFNGVHPFDATGRVMTDLNKLPDRIIAGTFPYAGGRQDIEPPTYALPYRIIPPALQELFSRCFVQGHTNLKARPTAEEWYNTLTIELKNLKECKENKNHIYSNHLTECPWCKRKSDERVDLFPYSSSSLNKKQNVHAKSAIYSLKSINSRLFALVIGFVLVSFLFSQFGDISSISIFDSLHNSQSSSAESEISIPVSSLSPENDKTILSYHSNSYDQYSRSIPFTLASPPLTITYSVTPEIISREKWVSKKDRLIAYEVPSEDSWFEIVVTNSAGKRVVETGYGAPPNSKGGYGNSNGCLKIYTAGDYTLDIRFNDIIVDVDIIQAS